MIIDAKAMKNNKIQLCRWRMKDVVGRFSPIRSKLGSKRRRKDEGEENRGRIREVLSTIGVVAQNLSQVQSMEALEDSVLNLTHTRSSNRLRRQSRITFNFLSGTAVMWRRPECLFLPKLEADNTR